MNRLEQIHACPCLPCAVTGLKQPNRTTAQHITSGGRRLRTKSDPKGDLSAYSCCRYHHLGDKLEGYTTQEMIGRYGPSFAHGKKYYQEVFGDERAVLLRIQDMLCTLQDEDGWETAPMSAIRGARVYWDSLKGMN